MDATAGLALIIWLLLSWAVMAYAGQKGRDRVSFFLLALFLSPLVAFVFAAVSPADPRRMGLRKCPQCAEWVKIEALRCRFCGSELVAGEAVLQPVAASPAPQIIAAKPGPRLGSAGVVGATLIVALVVGLVIYIYMPSAW
jgi:hypothetical protein